LKIGLGRPIRDLVFSPDGKTLVSCADQVVQFWDVDTALKRSTKASD
jgi:WD40 repeat protein